jgi:hypothetical protein
MSGSLPVEVEVRKPFATTNWVSWFPGCQPSASPSVAKSQDRSAEVIRTDPVSPVSAPYVAVLSTSAAGAVWFRG